MAWTAPRTWITSETVTAAMMNSHVRDNFLETSAATASAAGDLVYADAANSMGSRLAIGTVYSHLAATSNGPVWRQFKADSRSDSATGGAAGDYRTLGGVSWYNDSNQVEVIAATGSAALVSIKARMSNSTAGAYVIVSYSISGDTTLASSVDRGIYYESGAANDAALFGVTIYQSGLSTGDNTFTMTGYISSGQGTIQNPAIIVQPL